MQYYLQTISSQRREKQVSLFSWVAAEADGCHMQETPPWNYIPSLNPVSAIAASGIFPKYAISNLAQKPAFLLQTHTIWPDEITVLPVPVPYKGINPVPTQDSKEQAWMGNAPQ